MKKRVIIIIVSSFTILLAVFSLLALMAETHPYGPDDWRYGVQSWTERVRMGLIKEPAARFEYVLDVANYCLADLAAAETPKGVDAAARALAHALDVASQLTSAAVSEQREDDAGGAADPVHPLGPGAAGADGGAGDAERGAAAQRDQCGAERGDRGGERRAVPRS